MKHSIFFLLLAMLPILAVSQENNTQSTATQQTLSKVDVGKHPKLPNTPRIPVTDTYFGMKITDNYRWLENLKSPKVLKWLKSQSEYTNSYLDNIPGRDSLFEDFKRLDALKPATISDIQRKSGRYFFLKTQIFTVNFCTYFTNK